MLEPPLAGSFWCRGVVGFSTSFLQMTLSLMLNLITSKRKTISYWFSHDPELVTTGEGWTRKIESFAFRLIFFTTDQSEAFNFADKVPIFSPSLTLSYQHLWTRFLDTWTPPLEANTHQRLKEDAVNYCLHYNKSWICCLGQSIQTNCYQVSILNSTNKSYGTSYGFFVLLKMQLASSHLVPFMKESSAVGVFPSAASVLVS